MISKGAAQSWQMENRHKTMLAGHSSMASRSNGCARIWQSALTKRARNGASLALTALVDQFYGEVERMGGRRWDTSSLFARTEALRHAGGRP